MQPEWWWTTPWILNEKRTTWLRFYKIRGHYVDAVHMATVPVE